MQALPIRRSGPCAYATRLREVADCYGGAPSTRTIPHRESFLRMNAKPCIATSQGPLARELVRVANHFDGDTTSDR
jgi:hypothetical protein